MVGGIGGGCTYDYSVSLSPNLWIMTFDLDLDFDLGLTMVFIFTVSDRICHQLSSIVINCQTQVHTISRSSLQGVPKKWGFCPVLSF